MYTGSSSAFRIELDSSAIIIIYKLPLDEAAKDVMQTDTDMLWLNLLSIRSTKFKECTAGSTQTMAVSQSFASIDVII